MSLRSLFRAALGLTDHEADLELLQRTCEAYAYPEVPVTSDK